MKPNEFRLGNLIHVDNHIAKVVSISEMGIATKIVERASQSTNSGSRSPIPLTEEWLERFGFYNVEENTFDIEVRFGRYLSIKWEREKHEFWCTVGSRVDWIIVAKTQHVHQLQNLYFELTGEELKLKY